MSDFPDPNGHIGRYLELTERLYALRERMGDADCPEEDELLDEMDGAWYTLSSEEIDHVERVLAKGLKK